MIIKELPQIGNPSLREVSKEVTNIQSEETQKVLNDLIETFKSSSLVGMAAPQIGENIRIFLSEIRITKNRTPEETSELTIYINPKITYASQESEIGYEGCGSVVESNLFGPVERAKTVTVEAYDVHGEKFTVTASGLLARIIQHEYDHLEGILFTDRVADNTQLMDGPSYRASSKK